MDYKISFREMSELAAEQIAKQQPTTLEQARMQVLLLKNSELLTKKFSNVGSLEDARKNVVEFLKKISQDEYILIHSEFVYSQINKVTKKRP